MFVFFFCISTENRSPIPIPSPNFISRSACEPAREKEVILRWKLYEMMLIH